MSLDRSLKAANALIRHRNVLTRAERLDKLAEEDRWKEGKSVFGLPKVAHRKQAIAKDVKEEAVEGAVAGTPGAAPAAGAAPAGGAAGAKGGTGAKGAAPAAAPAKAAAPAGKKK